MNKETNPSAERVALYARVSSEAQAQEATIDSQLSMLCARMESDGYHVEPALCFVDDGVSGTTLVRPGLERLRDQAAAGAVDRLYVLAPDRLARQHVHQMVLVEELRACGVELVFVNRPLGTTPEDQLLLQVQSVIAEYERAKNLERTRRGRLHAARAGRISTLSHAPYGYRYIDKHTGGGAAAYEVVEDEARVVRQVFDWVGREGCSLREVGRRLEKMGIRTPTGLSHWNPATLGGMIRNSAYRGQAGFGKSRLVERRRLRPGRGHPEVPKTRCAAAAAGQRAHLDSRAGFGGCRLICRSSKARRAEPPLFAGAAHGSQSFLARPGGLWFVWLRAVWPRKQGPFLLSLSGSGWLPLLWSAHLENCGTRSPSFESPTARTFEPGPRTGQVHPSTALEN